MKLFLASKFNCVFDKAGLTFPKPNADLKVICITTAANVYTEENKGWLYEEMQPLHDAGMKPANYDIAGKSHDTVAAALAGADIVYISGGNTYYLLEQMQKCDFKSILLPLLQAGALYIGCSAGAVVACPRIDFIGAMDDPAKAQLADFTGLGLVPFLVVPHTDHAKYGPVAQQILDDLQDGHEEIVALPDSEALLIVNGHVTRI